MACPTGNNCSVLQFKEGTNFDDLSKNPKDTSESEVEEDTLNKDEDSWKYHIESIKVNEGAIVYQDFTLEEEFDYDLSNLDISILRLSSDNEFSPVKFSTQIEGGGSVELSGKVNTYTAQDFDFDF